MIDSKKKRFIDTLKSPFNQQEYVLFLKELLVNVQIIAPDKKMIAYNTAAVEHYFHIGNYIGSDNKRVALFSVCLSNDKNLENARSKQRNFVKTLIESGNCAAALVAFYTNGEVNKWRLSFVRLDYEFSKGKFPFLI